MLHFDDIVFGPVRSRRLGSSLGINILPLKGKLCNFDCIYCECGWNADGASDRRFPDYEMVKAALQSKIPLLARNGVQVDSITFSGNGEPTLNPDFPQIVDEVIRLRDMYFPDALVSVLSNATMLGRKSVAEALMKVDNPILKIDAPSDSLVSLVNRPSGVYEVAEVIENLRKFDGDFVLQTMFLYADGFSPEDFIDGWMEIVRELHPREIMVYTIDRQTPDSSLKMCPVETMKQLVRPLVEEGFNVRVTG